MTSEPHYQDGPVTLYLGDCLDVLRDMPDESVHAVVTDPPYGLSNTDPTHVVEAITAWTSGDRTFLPAAGGGFMGAAWDSFVPPPAVWDECYRILKPGGHLLTFAGTRTVDLMGLAVRLAGFDIRDSIAWLYGSGFPKSLDVGKAIDTHVRFGGSSQRQRRMRDMGDAYAVHPLAGTKGYGNGTSRTGNDGNTRNRQEPVSTDEAREWQGWGTALKPAFEPIVVARKPLAGTVAANVLAHSTGALNIDASRVLGPKPDTTRGASTGATSMAGQLGAQGRIEDDGRGRWPTNVALDESQAAELDRQAPDTGGSGRASGPSLTGATAASAAYGARNGVDSTPFYGDRGGASRMFPTFRYEAKAPTSERPVVDGVVHPTVKPLDLMRWLVRLVTPRGGTVLEPFAGSGTTIEAAVMEGFDVIGIEREPTYMPLIEKRIRKDHTQGFDIDWGDAS